MNAWLLAAAVLLAAIVPCGIVAARGTPIERLVGLEMAGILTTTAFIALAEGFGRSVYADAAVVFTLVNFVATLSYVRMLERSV